MIKVNSEVYSEGIIDDSLKAVGVDTTAAKNAWNDQDKNFGQKIQGVSDNTVGNVADTMKDLDDVLVKPNKVDTRSIVARAKNSVLQFPIYTSQSIRVNEAHIISKMFERVYTTLVQTVLSQNQYIDEDEANNLVFLRKFHSNIKEAADVLAEEYYNKYFEAIDEIDQMMSDSIFYSQQLNENCTVEFRWTPFKDEYLISENARLLNEPLKGFTYLIEANKNDVKDGEEKVREATIKEVNVKEEDIETMASNEGVTADEMKQRIKDGDVPNFKYSNGRYYRIDKSAKSTIRPKSTTDAPKILRDADIKKINGMVPFTIEASFRIKGRGGNIDRDIKYIIGIKSVLHLIRVQDLAEDLRDIMSGNQKNLQKIRYKTGEIGFMDYMFNIKGLKADAAKHVNYNKRWLNTLKRLGEYKNLNGTLLKKPVSAITGGNVPIPNGTLILTQPDVTMLTNDTGIDLSVVANAKKLANRLFLISVVIVDSSAGTMKVLFPDSDSNWDVQSLASIDAELSKTDNSQIMRELNRMVNK